LGDGSQRKQYQQLAEDLGIAKMCTFHGAVHPDDVMEMFKQAYISILPSRADSFPAVILESLACGTPVIAARVGSIPEVIEDNVNGLLFPAEDTNALSEAI
jgi:glycosyltransferase involved in cell wall biosynthesis